MATSDLSNRYIPSPIYPRMLGYSISLGMHVSNAVLLANTFKGEVLEDADVRRFTEDQFKFLTVWNAYMQMFYCALGLSCDILTLTKETKDSLLLKTLKKIRDPLFSSVVFPMSLAVFIVFWTVFSYERSLILPPSVDKTLGWSANHILHTAIVPVVLWEIVFRPRRDPGSHVPNLVLMYSYVAAYLVVLVTSYITTGAWVYPILNLLDGTIYLYLLLGAPVILLQAFYYLQWYLTDLIWGHREDMKNKVD
ncbi:hypothetical protein PYW07_011713 [Mythimna separata]|uniref:Androgen-dependent TFPI-regulating protein n=1 Tax=Mythimna separata TaxID=271217 RepID=A0AAD7Y750_MYTSE|nr:hypothetical protein PYW07_011713 [Mythimna separata]